MTKLRQFMLAGSGAVAALMVVSVAEVGAQDLFVYPEADQSPEEQSRDHGQCQQWAQQQSGYNPFAAPSQPQTYYTSSPPPSSSGTGALPGAARGAALGAVGGAIGGNAGKGAAIGAATGALFGSMRRRQKEQERAEWERRQVQQIAMQQEQARQQEARLYQGFQRAFAACMQARGYSVQ